MSETVRRRRRWPWVGLVLVGLVVGAPVAWQFHPLNVYERKLVGTWRMPGGPKITLTADRTIDPADLEEIVTMWSASRSHLYWRVRPRVPTSWDSAVITWEILTGGEKLSGAAEYTFDERGRMHLLPTADDREEDIWERVP